MAGPALNPWASHITERRPEIKSKHRSTCQLHKLWVPHYITGQTGSSVSPTTRSTGYVLKPLGLDNHESQFKKQSTDGFFALLAHMFLNLINGLNLAEKAYGCVGDQMS